jgi:hypothetical protein
MENKIHYISKLKKLENNDYEVYNKLYEKIENELGCKFSIIKNPVSNKIQLSIYNDYGIILKEVEAESLKNAVNLMKISLNKL